MTVQEDDVGDDLRFEASLFLVIAACYQNPIKKLLSQTSSYTCKA